MKGLLILIMIFTNSYSWTDYSRVVTNYDGLPDLADLEVKCQKGYAIRGFEIEHPSKSTLRYALHCIKPKNAIQPAQTYFKETNYDNCDDNRFVWLDRHEIKCDPNSVLSSFVLIFDQQQRKCKYRYTCLRLTSSMCHSYLEQNTADATIPGGNVQSIGRFPIVANAVDAALIGFRYFMNYNTDPWLINASYGWCITSAQDYSVKSTGIDIDAYYRVDDKEMLQFLSDFYEYYRRLSKYVSFTPHFVFDKPSIEDKQEEEYIEEKCVSMGKYCFNKKNGRYYLLETLRHICIYQASYIEQSRNDVKSLFWDFILYFNNKCNIENSFRLNCGIEIFEKYNLSPHQSMRCLSLSFGVEDPYREEIVDNENYILEREKIIFEEKFSGDLKGYSEPLIVLNGNKAITELNPVKVFEEICLMLIQSLKVYVTPCSHYYHQRKAMGKLMKIIIGGIVVFCLGIWCCLKKFSKLKDN